MKTIGPAFPALCLLLLLTLSFTKAADQADPTVRLRDMLRTTILQLRQSQADNATLQAAQAESAAKQKDLNDKLEAITKQTAADKEAADKTIDDLKAHLADQDTQIAQLKDTLTKWQDGYRKAADIANAKEAERAKLATQVILLQRKVDDREAKNAELFRIGNDILTRYERFGLGTALAAREPFVGITRVKLENQVQDYQDKLLDQKIRPGQ
jgi:chromosome segregation ATPase